MPARLVDGKPPRERRWGGPWVHALSVVLNGHAFEMLMRTSLGEASGGVVWTLLLVNLVALAVNVAFLLTHFDNMLRALLKRTTAATAATTTAVTSAAPTSGTAASSCASAAAARSSASASATGAAR